MGSIGAGFTLQFPLEILIAETKHAAIRVMDDEVLVRAQQVRRNYQRAQRVVGHAPPGVANHMRIAQIQAEKCLRMKPRVHARDDGQPAGR